MGYNTVAERTRYTRPGRPHNWGHTGADGCCLELFPFLIESTSRSPKNITGLFRDPAQYDRESYCNQDHCHDHIDHQLVTYC